MIKADEISTKSGSKVIVVGAGFAGLSAACILAQAGYQVQVLEKNGQVGGRARQYTADGFVFDMGPSWYWMPSVFESFFNRFGKSASDYYDLVKLDPGFQIIFGKDEILPIPADLKKIHALFEKIEQGASGKLAEFLEAGKRKYEASMSDFIYLPAHSIFEFAKINLLREAWQLDLFKPFDKYVARYFKDPKLRALMEFPVLFLGAKPGQIPALYSIMNYSALTEGTWYPMGGMHKMVEGFASLAQELGVEILTSSEVKNVRTKGRKVTAVETDNHVFEADFFIGAADYHHFETLLPESRRNYSEQYWERRTMSPSSLLFYVGVDRKLPGLEHHNLFFDSDFSLHAHEIYDEPAWPTDPQFYVCCPSKTDPSVAPEGKENLFFLMPIAPGLEDTTETRETYFNLMLKRTEEHCGVSFRNKIIYKRSYCISDFESDYHAYKGNAYGLANTLRQTAILKPKMKNKHLDNLLYTGQLTVPGPGMPPAVISGVIAGKEVQKAKSLYSTV